MRRNRPGGRGGAWRWSIATAIVAGLLATACSSTPSGSSAVAERDSGSASGPSATSPPLPTLTFDQGVELMASVGLAVFDDAEATDPLRPPAGGPAIGYTRWQAQNLVNEVNERNGLRGRDLDAAIPLGDEAPPLSFLLAAWLDVKPTPAARRAAELIGPQDWEQAPDVVFPTLVVALFVGDATAAAAGDDTSTATAPPTAAPAPAPAPALRPIAYAGPGQAGAVCGLVANFVDNSLNWIVGKLTIDPGGGGLGGFLATIWNTALQLAKTAVQTIVGPITDAVLAPIRIALAAVAVATMVVSYLKPWQLPVRPTPRDRLPYSIDGDPPNNGAFVAEAKIAAGTDRWPADLLVCAQGLDITLPELTAAGAPVEWKVQRSKPDAIEIKTAGPPWRTKLDAAKRSTLDFSTGHEPRDWADRGAPTTASAWVTAKVERKEVTELTQLVQHLIDRTIARVTGPLSGLASAAVQPFVDRLIAAARSKLPALLHVEGFAHIILDHHKAPDATTTTTTTAPPSAPSACDPAKPRFEPGTWRGKGTMASELTFRGEATAHTVTPGDLSFEVTVANDGTVTAGQWTATGMVVQLTGSAGNQTATYLGKGALTGRAERLEMQGGFQVSVMGTSMDVPAGGYPILPGQCRDGKLVGDITPPADAARQAAGVSGGFVGPFTAEKVA